MQKVFARQLSNDYVCDICEKHFSTIFTLKIHMKNVHDRIKEYRCGVCFRKFARNPNLKRHFKKNNENFTPYEFPICQTKVKGS